MNNENEQQNEQQQPEQQQQPEHTQQPEHVRGTKDNSSTLPGASLKPAVVPAAKTPEQRVIALEKFVEGYRKQHPYCGF